MGLLPREKLLESGLDSLSDEELVALVIGSGIEGKGFLLVAREVFRLLYRRIPSGNVSWQELTKVKGVGDIKAIKVVCAVELGRRIFGSDIESRLIIKSRDDVVREVAYLRRRKQEHVVVLLLNARNELVGKNTIAIGSVNKALVQPREVFRYAIEKGAVGVIIVHNHPSGDTDPSLADKKFTTRIKKAGEIIGIELVDHVIV
ncbi:DNA repair protein RadC [Candidatus Dojkabacteria bacterium]|nr:DNA repair protein RadC [Candidatus Dojkabacteria bacterium]